MLIPYSEIIKKYKLKIKNILHIGAHNGEEYEEYANNGCEKIVWIEANPFKIKNLQFRLLEDDRNIIINSVVSDVDGNDVIFNITNNGESSSILKLGLHKNLFPDIVVNNKISLKTKTINTIFKENNLDMEEVDFINLDVQGAELLALKGIGNNINFVKAVYTEINTDYVYEGCALLSEIDNYLEKFNFYRAETKMWENHPWGDALYLKKDNK